MGSMAGVGDDARMANGNATVTRAGITKKADTATLNTGRSRRHARSEALGTYRRVQAYVRPSAKGSITIDRIRLPPIGMLIESPSVESFPVWSSAEK
jgi:hypothetical protein